MAAVAGATSVPEIDAFPREFEPADEDDQVEEGREEDRVANDRE